MYLQRRGCISVVVHTKTTDVFVGAGREKAEACINCCHDPILKNA